MFKWWKNLNLFKKIMLGFAIGIITGLIMGPKASMFSFLGTMLIRLLEMVVAPLILSLLVGAVGEIGDMKTFGSLGIKTIAIYVCCTMFAIALGLGAGLLFNVGGGVNINLAGIKAGELKSFVLADTLVNMTPKNIFAALSEPNLLQIIVFALIFGFAALKAGENGKPMLKALKSLGEVMKSVTNIVLKFTPIGVFGLMANVIGSNGVQILLPYAKCIIAVYAASAFQTLVIHGFIMNKLLAKRSVGSFLKASKEAMTFAFATCSSVATIPLALKATKKLGVPDRISNFIITVGSNMSMDGIAIYQGVAVVFAAQIYNIHLTIPQYILVMISATIASLGVAGVPGSGLIVLSIVVKSVGLPMEAVALLAGVDRILNMGRIIPNLSVDISAAVLVSKFEGALEPELSDEQMAALGA
jgi:proton glutamate symport protein